MAVAGYLRLNEKRAIRIVNRLVSLQLSLRQVPSCSAAHGISEDLIAFSTRYYREERSNSELTVHDY